MSNHVSVLLSHYIALKMCQRQIREKMPNSQRRQFSADQWWGSGRWMETSLLIEASLGPGRSNWYWPRMWSLEKHQDGENNKAAGLKKMLRERDNKANREYWQRGTPLGIRCERDNQCCVGFPRWRQTQPCGTPSLQRTGRSLVLTCPLWVQQWSLCRCLLAAPWASLQWIQFRWTGLSEWCWRWGASHFRLTHWTPAEDPDQYITIDHSVFIYCNCCRA